MSLRKELGFIVRIEEKMQWLRFLISLKYKDSWLWLERYYKVFLLKFIESKLNNLKKNYLKLKVKLLNRFMKWKHSKGYFIRLRRLTKLKRNNILKQFSWLKFLQSILQISRFKLRDRRLLYLLIQEWMPLICNNHSKTLFVLEQICL